MQIKDLSVSVESLEDVRGGIAFVGQLSANGFVANDADVTVGGSGPTVLNSSPVSSVSNVGQLNSTVQSGAASDSYTDQFAIVIEDSVFDIF